ncbi:MAG: c-type cytochrome [Gemmatales bacterium]|nr:c-type cytochrome [Gemmatales bacterium]MDW8386099.1 c-type cytochrome [Gemmatales bacterium]
MRSRLACVICFLVLVLGTLGAAPPEMTKLPDNLPPFEYVEANIPFYPPGQRWGVTGEPIRKMQKPLSPDRSLRHYVHPVGFELRLFASEELLGGKPIAMNWDHRGRLWAALTQDYPNDLQPEGRGNDRIVICEDTDGDWRADKVTVFADKLSIPTSVLPYGDGAIVLQPPQTLYLRDTDGDDKADQRVVLFTGWGTDDTHAGPSNLRYGPDNWIYGIVGYAGFVGTVGGERHSFRQGFFRFRPDGSRLEFVRSTNNNSWGVGFSEEGLLFGSTANGCPSVFAAIPNRYYERVRGWSAGVLPSIATSNRFFPITDKVRQVDFHGGFTAAAGHALYTARAYPRDYWNRTAFVAEPTGHLVATFVLEPQGADFRARNSWNLVASNDEWAAPIMAEVGPDGCVWILDWYNIIVQHNPTPPGFRTGRGNAYETELRDKKHGRIYRLVPQGYSAPQRSLHNGSTEQLLDALKSDNQFWRFQAQRLLVEQNRRDAEAGLLRLLADQGVDEIGLNPGAIHAIWTLNGLGLLDGRREAVNHAVIAALKHPSAGVRRNAVLHLPPGKEAGRAWLQSGLLGDPEPQVRLAALLAAADLPPDPEVAAAVLAFAQHSENLRDRWLRDGIVIAAAAHDRHFLEAAVKIADPPFGLREIISRVAEHFARGAPVVTVHEILQSLPTDKPEIAELVIAALARGWPRNRPAEANPKTGEILAAVFDKLSPRGRGQLLTLTRSLGVKGMEKHLAKITETLSALAADESLREAERAQAARDLIELQPDQTEPVEKILDLITPRTPPDLAVQFLEAAGLSQSDQVGTLVLARFKQFTPSLRQTAIRVLLRRPASTVALLDALEKNAVPLSDLALDQRQALAEHPDRRLAERSRRLLERGGALPSADRQKVLETLAHVAEKPGDPVRGKKVFLDHCSKCHRHGTEGHQIGPDLTGMAVHPKHHLLLEILDPSRSVEGNFRAYTIATADGRVLHGLLIAESRTAVELVDVEAKKHVLLREDIEEMQVSTKSLMPEGFEKQLQEQDFADLLEFLTQRGKFLPLPLHKAATVVTTRGMFNDEANTVERLVLPDWKPRTVSGVPFQLIDPLGDRVPNAVLLYGPQGTIPPRMPKSVAIPCNAPAKTLHLLSGVSGWGFPLGERGSVTMTVRLRYADGSTEDHELKNGIHFADYIRRVDVPGSQFAFAMRNQQMRYLTIQPKKADVIREIELVKGPDATAPVVLAITVELPE